MVVLLGLAAAVLYGSGDFLGGMATRRAHVLTVLTLVETTGVIVALAAAVLSSGPASLAGLTWGVSAGLVGGLGLIIFYTGLAAGPMSVVAPVSGLVSTVLPVAVALAEGERPGARRLRGRAAVPGRDRAGQLGRRHRPRRNQPALAAWAGPSPTARRRASRSACSSCSSATPGSPARCGPWRPGGSANWRSSWPPRPCCGPALPRGVGGGIPLAAAGAGVIDVVANLCYVAATRIGAFGLAVVLASLYPGVTVLLARVVLGERLRWVQRVGLGLAAIGILLVAA